METIVKNSSELQEEAKHFVLSLRPLSAATIVALSGELGAGKTTFVQGVAKGLKVEETVTSPTFVILKIYHLLGQPFERLVHMDAYRLKGIQHLKVLGWEELCKDPKNLMLIEWPEKIEEALPPHAVRVALRYSAGDTRTLVWQPQNNKKQNE